MSSMTKEIEIFTDTLQDKKLTSNVLLVELLHSLDKRITVLEDKVEELETNKGGSNHEQKGNSFSIA